ncbi:MAG: hypothetical protein IKR73_00505, partial [Oscillospiraceae bacterium]|nr:hypothetical protein [Oscillospiraceae bacterium]
NIFGLSDGRAVKIQLFADEMTERDGKIYFYGNNRSLVSIGKAEDLLDTDGGILTPQAFNSSGTGSANGCVSFETEGPFRLIPDDYDADGDPDIVLRSSDIGEQGAYYSLLLSSKRYYPWQPNNCYTSIGDRTYPSDLRSNADATFFIWGEDDPSIKLRWLDDDHFFFLTMLEEGANDDTVFAFVVDRNTMTGERASTGYQGYVQDGRIYCAHYEDKTICCDIVDCSSDYPDDLIPPEGHGTVMLYRLDGSDRHKACGQPVDTMFIRKNSMESTAALQMELYPGLYRVDIVTDGCTGSAWLEVI